MNKPQAPLCGGLYALCDLYLRRIRLPVTVHPVNPRTTASISPEDSLTNCDWSEPIVSFDDFFGHSALFYDTCPRSALR